MCALKLDKLSLSDVIRGRGQSRNRSKTFIRVLLIVVLVAAGLLRLRQVMTSLEEPDVYRKDFLQEYLLARSVITGVNPYLPVSSLAPVFIERMPVPVLPHPTPHPPPVAVLAMPVGFLTYPTAATVWVAVELACLVGSVWKLLTAAGLVPSKGLLLLLSLAAVGWAPVWIGVISGQLMIVLLFLLSWSWSAFRMGKEATGGLFLGLAIAIKLLGIPIFLFLALRKRWTALSAAATTITAANLLAASLMGFGPVISYYTEVSRMMFPLYRAAARNISAWTLGWRVFDGTGSPVVAAFRAPPLIHSPVLAAGVSILVPLLLLAVGLLLASRAKDPDTEFGILVCVSVLFHPVAWFHYLVLMAIPLTIAARKLREWKFPGRECIFLLCLAILLVTPPDQLDQVSESFATSRWSAQELLVPFGPALFGLTYALSVIGVGWFVWYLNQPREFDAA